MVGGNEVAGVSPADLRAAVDQARVHGEGLEWSAAEWERVLSPLPPLQQQAVYLHVLLDHTHAEAAEQLDVSLKSMRQAWRGAVGRIRERLTAGK